MTELSFAAGSALRGFDVLVQQTRNQWPESAGWLGDAIVVDSLAKTYPDGTEAVRGISLRVAAGESFGILGPNGAGKSTTIGMLGTLVRPTAGRASVAGFDVVAEPIEVRRRIGFAMQQAGVDEFATPKELMILQGRLHGLRKHEAAARAGLLLGVMELAEEADRRLATLSSGTKRRVDLAASLMHLPPVLFLDEPTEGLDPRSRSGVWNTLDRLRSQLGVTLVLTTHYMEEGDRLCERIAIIDRGTVVAEGAPAALKATVGRDATLKDVYLHYTGRAFEEERTAA
jgi:ABC-2 type transport system ATP-binding protein